MIYRILAIRRLPLHLRWELAPVPHDKGKGRYGGSYLEESEWWTSRRCISHIAPVLYMAKEIFLLSSIWKHNRCLWPFSLAFHSGIYLFVLAGAVVILAEVLSVLAVPASFISFFHMLFSVLALAGCLLGSAGVIGLLLKRALDSGLRPFSTLKTYFHLLFSGAVFISGVFAWFIAGNYLSEVSALINGLFTLDTSISVSLPLTVHLILVWLFILYLPFSNMIHFAAKYFLYHGMRWNDAPQDEQMARKVQALLNRPVSWSAEHISSGGRKSWAEVASRGKFEKKEP